MTRRVLVLKAGSAPSNNLIRSLKAGDPALVITGCHDDRFVLKKSDADKNYIVPLAPQMLPDALRKVIQKEGIDLVIPTNDADVLWLSKLRADLPCKVFLPSHATIELCQDKYALTTFLRRRRIPAPLTYPVTRLSEVNGLFRRMAPRKLLWCRIRSGSGSLAAIPVRTPEQVRSWISYWQDMRGVPEGAFTLSEYLPGRDFCVQSLWRNGDLILSKMAERLTYLDTGGPSGVSSMPALAKTAFEPAVIHACTKAVRAIDPKTSGVLFLDIKESEDGKPCITEINAGRFATMTNIHDLSGQQNMAAIYVRLAMGDTIEMREAYDYVEDVFLVRSVDTVPAVMEASQLYEGIGHLRS